ncbi:MAG: ABC transporter permease [Planctomycetes bacterium]|nr:ABC transporter permease [Planctomycetota bacterium]
MPLPLYYNWRSLLQRRLSSSLTFILVAVVVFVLSVLLSFAAGINKSLAATGSLDNLLILKPGATSESTSIIKRHEADRLVQVPHVALNAAGAPLISRELCVQTSIPRINANKDPANVAIRGVDTVAFDIHQEVQIASGRKFQLGALEAIVGSAASQRYANLTIGSEITLGRLSNRIYKVVGIFDADGGALESEIWVGRTMLEDAYDRRFHSSVVIRLTDAAHATEAIQYISGPTVQLNAKQEPDYYAELSKTTAQIVELTTILIAIMVVGAIFAVANTMYAAVDGRKREIAMLRTIGFSKASILTAFIVESVLICTCACVAGLAACTLVHGSRRDFLSDTTWTVMAYELRITPAILAVAMGTAILVGAGGALMPALKASRTHVIEALRKA